MDLDDQNNITSSDLPVSELSPTPPGPPITMPDDILNPDSVTSTEIPMESYAPQPTMVANPEYAAAPEQAPVPKMPDPPAPINPAMVPDPLAGGQPPVAASITSPPETTSGVTGMAADPQQTQTLAPSKVKSFSLNGKFIFLGGICLVVLVILGIGGYFGYNYYIASSNTRILQTASSNLATAKQMSTNITVGMDAVSLTGKLDVDKDQNLRFTTSAFGSNLAIIYLKGKDTLYFGTPSYSSTGTASQTAKNYSAYTNIKKAYDTISKTYVNLSALNPKSNYFTADNLQYITRDPDESVGGNSLYKFTFKPTKAYLQKSISDLRSKSQNLPFDVSNTDLSADIWINKNSLQVVKVVGNVSVSIKPSSSLSGLYGETEQAYKLSWNEDFDYNFKDTIKMPIGAKVTGTTDAATMIDDTFGEGASLNQKDAVLRSNAMQLETALEVYYSKHRAYPTSGNKTEVVALLKKENLLASRVDMTGIEYFFDAKSNKYTIRFKLKDQMQSGLGISGTAPNKYESLEPLE